GVGVDHVGATLGDPGATLRHRVDPDDPVPTVQRNAAGHVADRAQDQHDQASAVGDAGVLHGLPRGRQHVGEVDVALVGTVGGHLDGGELGLTHAQVLRLSARHLAVQLGVAVQRSAHAVV